MKGWRLALLLLVACARPSWPDQIEDAARELARKISTVSGAAQPAGITVRNQSSLNLIDAARIRRILDAELGHGLPSDADVQVTLSENFRGLLWVAEVRRAGDKFVVMIAPRPPDKMQAPAFLLQASPVQEFDEPILDVAFTKDGGYLVLTAAQVLVYRNHLRQASMPVAIPPEPSRDPRGKLQLSGDSFQAYLPGLLCSGTVQPSAAMECRASEEPWPLDGLRAAVVRGRNFFSSGGSSFYSTAQAGPYRLYARLDRQVEVRGATGNLSGTASGWGSDVAGVDVACGQAAYVLAAGPGEDAVSDFVQAYEIIDGQPRAKGDPVQFPGPVTALWRAGAASAVVVVRNSKTDRYAAYDLAIACSP